MKLNKALQECLRKEWELPKEHKFRDAGQEWVLLQNISHRKKYSVKQSAQFIISYLTFFL
jgi:hypothetical protein